MRRLLLPTVFMAVFLAPTIASGKLPFYGLDVDPIRPRVGDPITLTMTCYDDEDYTEPMSGCMGAGGWDRMAWVHPLDEEGTLDRSDWITVKGHATSSGATRGWITLDEPGAYDVMPLWRTWDTEARDGFPGFIRIEVTDGTRITSVALAAFGVAGTCLAVAAWRRRTIRSSVIG